MEASVGRMVLLRILYLPLVLFGLTIVLFAISQVIPSDPARLIVGDYVSPSVRAAINAKYGLNQPVVTQYGKYIARLLHGDLGTSIRYNVSVSSILRSAFPATLELVAAAAVVNMALTFGLGVLAARFRNTAIDAVIRGFALIGTSTATFIVAIVCILIFGFYLNVLPISGRGSPPDLAHLILPAFVLGYSDAGNNVRVFRASLIDSMGKDYVRAARGRGINERTILLKHAGLNSLGPTVTVLGLSVARIAGSVILVETVFSWPGIGQLLDVGILWNDFPLLTGALLLLLVYTLVVTLIVDVLYRVIDPRLRSEVS
jgi:ABC-type dipeptide/oligopeptide/nickel transport system permease component